MKKITFTVYILFIALTVFGCKDKADTDSPASKAQTEQDSNQESKEKPAETQRKIANSLMAKLMVTPELRSFTSNSVSAGMADMLSKNEGPYTIIAPSNDAFASLSEFTQDELSNPNNKEMLATLLKNHIVEEDLTSANLLQSVKKNNTYTLKTLGGENIMVYLEGADILMKDSNGVIAKLGKSDIMASNGKVHIIDAVLTAAK